MVACSCSGEEDDDDAGNKDFRLMESEEWDPVEWFGSGELGVKHHGGIRRGTCKFFHLSLVSLKSVSYCNETFKWGVPKSLLGEGNKRRGGVRFCCLLPFFSSLPWSVSRMPSLATSQRSY